MFLVPAGFSRLLVVYAAAKTTALLAGWPLSRWPLVFLIMHVCWGLSLVAGLLFRLPAQLIQSLRSGH